MHTLLADPKRFRVLNRVDVERAGGNLKDVKCGLELPCWEAVLILAGHPMWDGPDRGGDARIAKNYPHRDPYFARPADGPPEVPDPQGEALFGQLSLPLAFTGGCLVGDAGNW